MSAQSITATTQTGGFRNGSQHIYYYARLWTGVDSKTLASRHFKTYNAAAIWLARA